MLSTYDVIMFRCFGGKGHREAHTMEMDLRAGGKLTMYIVRDPSDAPTTTEDLLLSYSTDGYTWTPWAFYYANEFFNRNYYFVEEPIPSGARTQNTKIKLEVTGNYTKEQIDSKKWGVDNIKVMTFSPPTAGSAGFAADLGKVDLMTQTKSKGHFVTVGPNLIKTDFLNQFTIEGWVKLDGISDVFIRKLPGTESSFRSDKSTRTDPVVVPAYARDAVFSLSFGTQGNNSMAGRSLRLTLHHARRSANYEKYSTYLGPEVPLREWVHFVVVFNATAVPRDQYSNPPGNFSQVSMWLNGIQQPVRALAILKDADDTKPYTGPYPLSDYELDDSYAGPIVLGSFPDESVNGFNGRIDDIRIWSKARTSWQATLGANPRLYDDKYLVARWTFDILTENRTNVNPGFSANVIHDDSGNGIDLMPYSTLFSLVASDVPYVQEFKSIAYPVETLIYLPGVVSAMNDDGDGIQRYDPYDVLLENVPLPDYDFPYLVQYMLYDAVYDNVTETYIKGDPIMTSKHTIKCPGYRPSSPSQNQTTGVREIQITPAVYFVSQGYYPGVHHITYRVVSKGVKSLTTATVRMQCEYDKAPPPPPVEDEVEVSTFATVLGTASGFAFIGALAGVYVYYFKVVRVSRAPLVPVPVFRADDAWHEKYYQQPYNETYLKQLAAVEDLLQDMRTVVALTKSVQITEADEMCKSLIYVFEVQGHSVDLIKREIDSSTRSETLFRGNSIASKLLKAYSRMIGMEYLHATLSKVLNEYCFKMSLAEAKMEFEVDDSKVDRNMDSETNKYTLMHLSQQILSSICKSTQYAPVEFRVLCNHLAELVAKKWPEFKLTAVGSFLFLRFFAPAVVAPKSMGLIGVEPSDKAQRMLTLVAKTLQNCANDVEFGKKEPYMVKMNDFIKSNRDIVAQFFTEMSSLPDDYYEDSLDIIGDSDLPPRGAHPVALINLHRHMFDNKRKINLFLRYPQAEDYAKFDPDSNDYPEDVGSISLRNGIDVALKLLPRPYLMPRMPQKRSLPLSRLWKHHPNPMRIKYSGKGLTMMEQVLQIQELSMKPIQREMAVTSKNLNETTHGLALAAKLNIRTTQPSRAAPPTKKKEEIALEPVTPMTPNPDDDKSKLLEGSSKSSKSSSNKFKDEEIAMTPTGMETPDMEMGDL